MSADLQTILSLADDYLRELPPAPPALILPSGAGLAGWIDHTILKPEATADQIQKLCEEARLYRFATVCVNPLYVDLCARLLQGSGVLVCSVVGFPLGATMPEAKALETRLAIEAGAAEIDTVIPIGALRHGDYDQVRRDVSAVVAAAAGRARVKVILEMCYLDQHQKIVGCLICKQAGVDFVKTSTGFGPGGATAEDVDLMRRVVGAGLGVKAAGGIRTLPDALNMITAGANRLGASASVSILREAGVL